MLRIGFVSGEKHWAKQVATIFPESKLHVERVDSPRVLAKPDSSKWDAVVLDLDTLDMHSASITDYLELVSDHSRHKIVLIPQRLAGLESSLVGNDAFILRKPTSSGEIALALRMLFREL